MLDKILTNKIFAIPIFLGIMMLIFYLTFNSLGAYLNSLLATAIDKIVSLISYELLSAGVNPAFHVLIIDGVCAGVGSVLSFLPTIAVMFGCIAILENSGYMPRIALVMNELLAKLGLPGQSIVPLLIGFGCSVPAIIATRSLASRRDRCLTIALIPFMSCSAKLPVYMLLVAAFFPNHRTLVLMAIYLTGIAIAIICALILKRSLYRGKPSQIPPNLPPYRIPPLRPILYFVAKNITGFVKKAFTVIFMAAIVIWFLQSFDTDFLLTTDSEESILAFFAKHATPVFAPLGFGDWRAVAAVITGLSAKEAVVSTLAVLASAVDGNSVDLMLTQIFTPLSAFAFLIFCLLYVPCIATLAAIKKEMGKWRYAFAAAMFQIAVAWLTTFLIFNIGSFLTESTFVLLLFNLTKMFIMGL